MANTQDLTPQEIERIRNSFVEGVTGGDADAVIKTASAASDQFTRRRMREESFFSSIIPFTKVNNSQLWEQLDREDPAMLFEMEADQWTPKTISFNDTADTHEYRADKYILAFFSNTTPEWTKNINYLRTYRSDVRQLITDNSLRDLSRLRDMRCMGDVDEICGPIAGGISEYTGLEQYVVYPGRLDRNNWVSTQQLMHDRMLLNGVMLCNQRTWSEFQRWDRQMMGGDFAQDLALKGNGAFKTAEMSNIPFVVTMKSDIVNNGIIYAFAPSNYLGKAAVLEEPTMYVKKEKDILRFSCREIIGMTIANTAGVQKVAYKDVTGVYGGDGRIVLTTTAEANSYAKVTDPNKGVINTPSTADTNGNAWTETTPTVTE